MSRCAPVVVLSSCCCCDGFCGSFCCPGSLLLWRLFLLPNGGVILLAQIGPSKGKPSPTVLSCRWCRVRRAAMAVSNNPMAPRSLDSASAHDAETFGGMLCHSNGILVGDPIWPERGAYVQQCFLSEREGVHLPWWGVPPSDRKGRGWSPLYRGLAAGTVFGPVHKVDDTLDDGGFISVQVPPPLCKVPREDRKIVRQICSDLVWINIFTNRQGGREVKHHYCTVVDEEEVAAWRRLGWKDIWIEKGQTLIATSWNTLQPAPSSASRIRFFGLLAE